MIRWWFDFDSGTGSTRCCGLVVVREVLDDCGMQGGEPCMLVDGLFGLHSFNTCLMLLGPNVFSLLAFTQIIPCISLFLI